MTDHACTIVEHGARRNVVFVRCNDCDYESGPTSHKKALTLVASHVEAAYRASIPRFGFDYRSATKPARPRRAWSAYRSTSTSVTADVFYTDDGLGVGTDMTFPSRKVLVEHLREFAHKGQRCRHAVLAVGEDHDGEFVVVAEFSPRGLLRPTIKA